MITFYPRDIGLWRSDFDFSDRNNHPTKTFKDRDELSKFVDEKFNADEWPTSFIVEKFMPFDATHIVHKWTVMGWIKEEKTTNNQ
jgi:hypothetical protein